MKVKKLVIAAVTSAAVLSGGGVVGVVASTSPSSAATVPVYNTTSKTQYVISPRCLHLHQVTKTYWHWSKNQYVRYPNGPTITTTDKTTCHK